MLYKTTVDPHTLELIIRLQNEPVLKSFFLVGGTALALQIGHRISVDIDLFTTIDFDTENLSESLQGYDLQMFARQRNTIIGAIDNIKVDFIAHKYPLVSDLLTDEDVRMASKADIAAMKINAIANNGTRVKDFIDIYYLFNDFSLPQILAFYKQKYQQDSDFHAVKSLCFFDDVDLSDWPLLTDKKLKWPQVMKRIQQAVKEL